MCAQEVLMFQSVCELTGSEAESWFVSTLHLPPAERKRTLSTKARTGDDSGINAAGLQI